MQAPLEVRHSSFADRVRPPRWWSWLTFRASRFGVALALALVPAALLFLAVALGPEGIGRAVTDRTNVSDTFSRFISGLVTAATIAVSVATLSMRRGIAGIGELREHVRADESYRDAIRRAGGHDGLPLAIAPFLRVLLLDIEKGARDASARARSAGVEDVDADGEPLHAHLDVLARIAARGADEVVRHQRRPHRVLSAVLDVEVNRNAQLTRRFARDDRLPEDLREVLCRLCDRLDHLAVGRGYAKSLQLQWGLSRMSTQIMLTSFLAVVVAAGMTLAYGQGAVDAFGTTGAAGIVTSALFLVLMPIAIFVSYMVRFVFLNAHTLPIGGFALGPEEEALLSRPGRSRRPRRAGGA